jgi:hypothetical protein
MTIPFQLVVQALNLLVAVGFLVAGLVWRARHPEPYQSRLVIYPWTTYFLHATIFYIAVLWRVYQTSIPAINLSDLFATWSSLLRLHSMTTIVLIALLYISPCQRRL